MTTDKVTDATAEPLTLADAKTHLRETLVDAGNDAYITSLITVARTAAEERLHRTLLQTIWLLTLDAFPGGCAYPGSGFAPHLHTQASLSRNANAILLENPPIISVDWIKYIDASGALQTLDAAGYIVDASQNRGQIMPAYGTSWPVTQARINAVTAQYKAGYGASADKVPAPIVHWIKLALSDLYERRRRSAEAPSLPQDFADGLLAPYRLQPI